jgi:phosphoribosylformylglycinamidine synthase PurS subunit
LQPNELEVIVAMPLVKIAVTLKPTLLDAQGRVVQSALHQLGYDEIGKVRIGRYIEVEMADGSEIGKRVDEICAKLLANPVIEDYTYEVIE